MGRSTILRAAASVTARSTWLLAAVCLVAANLASSAQPARQSDRFPNIKLQTQHGDSVRFYDDLVSNRVVVINFMYTDCGRVCPGTIVNLGTVHEMLGDRVGSEIVFLSLSIDPETDTPERLNEYWRAFGSKPGWLFLTGDYSEIEQLRHALGVYDLDPAIDGDKTQHSGIVTFGNDRTDRWAALPALMDATGLAETILRTARAESQPGRNVKNARAAGTPRRHRGTGVVRQVRPETGEIVIAHETIPGLMMPMTMGFPVADPSALEALRPGQSIDFLIEYRAGAFSIIEIEPGEH